MQHEIQNTSNGRVKIVDEKDVALTFTGKNKGKAKTGALSDGAKGKEKRKKKDMDMSKFKCLACHKMGHYGAMCLVRKKNGKKGIAALAELEQFVLQFDKEFAFITYTSSRSTSSNVWYIDSGASRHMTGAQEFFSDLAKREIDIDIVLGYDRTVRVFYVGTVTFKREYLPPLKFMDVYMFRGRRRT